VKAKKSRKIKVLAQGYAKRIKRNKYNAGENKDQIEEENSDDEKTQEIDMDDLSDTDKEILEQLEFKMNQEDGEEEGEEEHERGPAAGEAEEGQPKDKGADSKATEMTASEAKNNI